MSDSPPIYLALDLWIALGLDSREFDAYYGRNGWEDTWSNLLGEVRTMRVPYCLAMTDEGPCVLHRHTVGPHMAEGGVGHFEPLPFTSVDSPNQENRSTK
jgi:hypothetical protein